MGADAAEEWRLREPPLTGRESELSWLWAQWEDVCANSTGRLIFIAGPAGIGKSRLIGEFASDLLAVSDASVYTGAAVDSKTDEPYVPFHHAFSEEGIWSRTSDGEESALQRLRKRFVGEFAAEAPGALLSMFVPYGSLVQAAVAALVSAIREGGEPQDLIHKRDSAFLGFYRCLQKIARKCPVLLILEDMHWADRSSVALLAYLAEQIAADRIMIAVTYRPEDLEEMTDREHFLLEVRRRLTRERLCFVLELTELPADVIAEMGEAMLSPSGELDDRFRSALTSFAEGNPLYGRELIGHLMLEGELTFADGRWSCAFSDDNRPAPREMESIVEARWARLSETLQALLRTAAVIGRSFPAALVMDLSDVSDMQFDIAIANLVSQRLIAESATEADSFAFTSQHIHQFALDQTTRLRAHHRRIANIAIGTEHRYGLTEMAIAEHYELAGEHSEAIPLYRSFGDACRAGFGYWEARESYYRASLMAHESSADGTVISELLLRIGECSEILGETDAAADAYIEIVCLLKNALSDALARARMALGRIAFRACEWDSAYQQCICALAVWDGLNDDRGRVQVYNNVACIHMVEGRFNEAAQALEAAMQLAVSSAGSDLMAKTNYNRGVLADVRGDKETALELYRETSHLVAEDEDEEGLQIRFNCETAMAVLLTETLHDLEQGRQHLDHALALAKELGDERRRAQVLRNIGYWYEKSGCYSEALDNYHTCADIFHRMGDRHWHASTLGRIGVCLADLDNTREARSILTTACQELEAIGDRERACLYGKILQGLDADM